MKNSFHHIIKESKELLRKKSIKDYTSVILSQFAVKPIVFIRGIVVAKYLGPSDYGLLKGVELISMLNKFGNLGFTQYAMREIGSIKNSGKEEIEQKIRDTAYSSELLLVFLLLSICIAASFYATTILVSIALVLSGLSMAIDKVVNMLVNDSQIERKFVDYSKMMFFTTLAGALLTIATVPFFGIYASLVLPILVGLFKGKLFYSITKITYRFKIHFNYLKKQLIVGTQLAINTLAYGSYRYSERLLIISMFDLKAVGYYGLSDTVLAYCSELFLSAIRVRKMNLFELLGKKEYRIVSKMVFRETVILIFGSIMIMTVLWLIIDYFVLLLLPKYSPALIIIKLLIFVLPFKVSTLYVNAVLVSSQVNMQKYIAIIQFSATGLFVLSAYFYKKYLGLSLELLIVLDIVYYAFYHISIIILYYFSFIKKILNASEIMEL